MGSSRSAEGEVQGLTVPKIHPLSGRCGARLSGQQRLEDLGMINEDKFGGRQQVLIYRQTMERLSEDVVRYRLANRMPIGDSAENNPPPELANAWLTEKAARRRKAEDLRYWAILIVAVISAIAAIIAALPVIRSWI